MKEAEFAVSIIDSELLALVQYYPFRIGLMSDLHVGAQHGLFPVGFGEKLNGGQKALWRYLKKFIGEMNKCKVNVLVFLGDILGGQNWKERGTYMMRTELEWQSDACAFLINYICEKVPTIKQVLFFKGTPYHGSRDVSVENMVAGKLSQKYQFGTEGKPKAIYLGEYAYITLKYGKYKKLLWLAHPATSASVYPETVLGRDIGQFLQAFAMKKIPKVDMIIRAHRHEYMELHKSTIRYMVLPCWQFYVPYDKAVKWYSKWQPDIGGAILLADDQIRLRPWHFTYPNLVNPKRFLTLKVKVGKKCLS